MKPRHIALGVALVLAAGLLAFGDRSPQGEVAEAVERPGVAPAGGTRSTTAPVKPVPVIARLVPRDILIGTGLSGKAGVGGADSLFGRQDWTPSPPPPKPAPPAPPSAPPLPFTVIGKSLEDGKWEVYLASGERTHIANEGAVLDGAWRIERIAPPLMTLTYLPLNQVQQLNIGVFE
jgi:hypothetical protein